MTVESRGKLCKMGEGKTKEECQNKQRKSPQVNKQNPSETRSLQ